MIKGNQGLPGTLTRNQAEVLKDGLP